MKDTTTYMCSGDGADNNTDWSFITFLLQQSVRTVAGIIPNKNIIIILRSYSRCVHEFKICLVSTKA